MSPTCPELVLSKACPEPRRRVEPPALPDFRIHWSDLAISLAGASLVFAATLLWRYLAPTSLASLYCTQMVLRLEMLLLLTQSLPRTGTATWGLVLVGVALVTALTLAVWDLALWKREALLA